MKVDQQGYRTAGQLEVCHYGGGVNAFNALNGFQLDYHSIVHQEIEAVSAVHLYPSIRQRYRFLPVDTVASFDKFPMKTGFVAGLEQPRSELAVYIDRRSDDGTRQFVDVHSECSERSVVHDPLEVCLTTNPADMPRADTRMLPGDI